MGVQRHRRLATRPLLQVAATPARRAPVRVLLLWAWVCVGWMPLGCGHGGADRKAELGALYEQGDLAGVVERAQRYLDDGATDPWVHRYLGLALLRQNEDRRAEPALRAAAAQDTSMGPALAEQVRAAATADLAAGWDKRAQARMTLAFDLDPRIELGRLLEPVAQAIYSDREFARALPLYRRLVDQGDPNEKKVQEWTFRLGFCLERTEQTPQAVQVYRDYLKRWPGGSGFKRNVMWRYQAALLDEAEPLISKDPGAAMPLIQEAMAPGWNAQLLQRARVLAGRVLEAQGKPSDALQWYAKVVESATNNADEQPYVQQATQRIEALRGVRTN